MALTNNPPLLARCMGGAHCNHAPGTCTATNADYQAQAREQRAENSTLTLKEEAQSKLNQQALQHAADRVFMQMRERALDAALDPMLAESGPARRISDVLSDAEKILKFLTGAA